MTETWNNDNCAAMKVQYVVCSIPGVSTICLPSM